MNTTIKSLLTKSSFLVDLLLPFFLLLTAPFWWGFRRFGAEKLPISRTLLKRLGVFPIINHYYEPMFNENNIRYSLSTIRNLPGIDLQLERQVAFLSDLVFGDELYPIVNSSNPTNKATQFQLKNGSFEAGDAEFLYQFIRKVRPEKIVEIGSGSSTKIAAAALAKNLEVHGTPYFHVCIEPYEQPWLEELPNIKLHRQLIETVDMDWENELKAGDLLFIDSSHMVRPQGDVLTEFLEILPRLSSGVYVHVHDIFTPRDYPQVWIKERVRFWNEQYLLEALLSSSSRYEVVASLNHLKHTHFNSLREVCPYLTSEDEPGSFYMKIR